MKTKTNMRFRPSELAALGKMVGRWGKSRNAVIGLLLFREGQHADEARKVFNETLAGTNKKTETRVGTSVRVSVEDLSAFVSLKESKETFSEAVRAKLKCRQISKKFQAAAYATALREKGPVLTQEQIKQYMELVLFHVSSSCTASGEKGGVI
jgi:hypothetical protein